MQLEDLETAKKEAELKESKTCAMRAQRNGGGMGSLTRITVSMHGTVSSIRLDDVKKDLEMKTARHSSTF